jgi:hypothetical protein
MDEFKHFGITAGRAIRDAVQSQRPRRRATALIESGKETRLSSDLLAHCDVGHVELLHEKGRWKFIRAGSEIPLGR